MVFVITSASVPETVQEGAFVLRGQQLATAADAT
jgi:hypothetical protein